MLRARLARRRRRAGEPAGPTSASRSCSPHQYGERHGHRRGGPGRRRPHLETTARPRARTRSGRGHPVAQRPRVHLGDVRRLDGRSGVRTGQPPATEGRARPRDRGDGPGHRHRWGRHAELRCGADHLRAGHRVRHVDVGYHWETQAHPTHPFGLHGITRPGAGATARAAGGPGTAPIPQPRPGLAGPQCRDLQRAVRVAGRGAIGTRWIDSPRPNSPLWWTGSASAPLFCLPPRW